MAMRYFAWVMLTLTLLLAAFWSQAGIDPRTMVINREPLLGLEIWTESVPAWPTRIETHAGKPVFIAESPPYYYPPGSMSWATFNFEIGKDEDFQAVFDAALSEAKQNYRLPSDIQVETTAASYGPLKGLEGRFIGKQDNDEVEVLFFVGQGEGGPAVVMQTLSLPGKLDHLKYQVLRSWDSIKYLDQKAGVQ
ncbi:MAG: hypothetical protein ACK5ME_11060 [Parahaliea sp.]